MNIADKHETPHTINGLYMCILYDVMLEMSNILNGYVCVYICSCLYIWYTMTPHAYKI